MAVTNKQKFNKKYKQPLKTANGVIGVIACQAYNNAYSFTHEDVELISFVSNQI